MPRQITPRTTLENLKREAKRWLAALRTNAADARARLERAVPNAPDAPTLRDVQRALALEHGFPGWAALKERVGMGAPASDPHGAIVRRFLDNACPDHHVRGGSDHLRARHTAMRLLARYPEIAHSSFYTAAVCGDVAAVRAALADDPRLATSTDATASVERSDVGRSGDLNDKDYGPKGWTPLLYLTFTRLPLDSATDNAIEIARALLDSGANPNAYFMAGASRYTPMVGAIGEGEEARPAHPRRDELVRLLLERGANPYDVQVLYNIHFLQGDALWFFELIYEHALRTGRKADWDDPNWSMLDMGGYGPGAYFWLKVAIGHNDLRLAEWFLTHGASASIATSSHPKFKPTNLYEEAIRRGYGEMAELLLRHGAPRTDLTLSPSQRFIAACLRMDRDEVRRQLALHPDYLANPAALLEAARRDRRDIVEFLLDLGISPNVENEHKERALHIAAYHNSLNVAQVLIDRGAEIDSRTTNWNNTPLGAANYSANREMVDLLSCYSRDVWELAFVGKLERLRELFTERPELARISSGEHTQLMWLPTDDEANAIRIATLFLAHGADATRRNEKGMTAADRAERIGMFELATLLRSAASESERPTVERYERVAQNLLDAYRTGTPDAMERHWSDTWHRRSWDAMRRYVQLDLGKRAESGEGQGPESGERNIDITLDDARYLVARENGFDNWRALLDYVEMLPPTVRTIAAKPVRLFPGPAREDEPTIESTRDWEAAIATLASGRASGIAAAGQMTDELLERISRAEHVTALRLGNSSALTDEGLRHLARMPQLRDLDLSGCHISDRGLDVLRSLPALERISLSWTGVTDAGVASLAACEHLERVDLTATATGDGAIRALAGKRSLRDFRSGNGVTDAGIPLLHDIPSFKKWQDPSLSVRDVAKDSEPSSLFLRGPFTDRGLAALSGLDGLFALNVDDSALAITAAGLAPLATLPNLGRLAVDAVDASMPYIAALPRLRFLMCQDTTAGDDGFVALSRSQSIEHIWGRRCHNLRSRGFTALSDMPALCYLSVSCLNVDDSGLAALPRFPALRELMPMDVPDDGYRYVGQCARLESLVLMYCRDTTDDATDHITSLPNLRKYFASYTRITDRTPELLSRMQSLEEITFNACAGLSNAGISMLARLPRLRELRVEGMPKVTREVVAAFPSGVRVVHSL